MNSESRRWAEAKRAFWERGWTVVEGVLPADRVAEVAALAQETGYRTSTVRSAGGAATPPIGRQRTSPRRAASSKAPTSTGPATRITIPDAGPRPGRTVSPPPVLAGRRGSAGGVPRSRVPARCGARRRRCPIRGRAARTSSGRPRRPHQVRSTSAVGAATQARGPVVFRMRSPGFSGDSTAAAKAATASCKVIMVMLPSAHWPSGPGAANGRGASSRPHRRQPQVDDVQPRNPGAARSGSAPPSGTSRPRSRRGPGMGARRESAPAADGTPWSESRPRRLSWR